MDGWRHIFFNSCKKYTTPSYKGHAVAVSKSSNDHYFLPGPPVFVPAGTATPNLNIESTNNALLIITITVKSCSIANDLYNKYSYVPQVKLTLTHS